MRIGTWNLAGRWNYEHERLLLEQRADVWLLTEVSERTVLEGWHARVTDASMATHRRWAGVFSRAELVPLGDPHPASAMARVGGLHFCSSILPWKGARSQDPWVGTRHADKTEHAVRALLDALPTEGLVWGGDWNHALSGGEYAGSRDGRAHLLKAIETLGLQVATALLPHRLPDLLSIDHIAVPASAQITSAEHIVAAVQGRRLSDHDAYLVEVDV